MFIPKTPYVTTDGIIELYKDDIFQGIVLIDRLNTPFGLAIPGGFVDVGEKIEDALVREMKEETSLDVQIEYLLGVYSDPSRDSRFHTMSVCYVAKASGTPKAQDDAKSLAVYKLDKIPLDKLVFDHKEMIEDYLEKKNNLTN